MLKKEKLTHSESQKFVFDVGTSMSSRSQCVCVKQNCTNQPTGEEKMFNNISCIVTQSILMGWGNHFKDLSIW